MQYFLGKNTHCESAPYDFVDSKKEDPEREVVDFISAFALRFEIRSESLQSGCGVTNDETKEESTVLQMPHGPPDFKK